MPASYQSFDHQSNTLGGNTTVTKPTGTVSGDLLLAITNCSQVVTPPAGWTTHTTLSAGYQLHYKVAGGSEPASYTFDGDGIPNLLTTVVRVSGADQANPIDQVTGITGTGAGALVLPDQTVSGPNRLLMQLANKQNSGAFSFAAGTERFDSDSTNQNWPSAGADETVNAGSTGTRSITPPSGGAMGVAFLVSINPADRSADATPLVETVSLSGAGATGTSKGSSLAPAVGLTAAGGGAVNAAPTVAAVALSASGQTNVYGEAEAIVTATRTPTESTINDAEGTEVVTLEGEASTGAASGASQIVTAGLTAAVLYGTSGVAPLAAVTTLEATGQLDTYQGASLAVTAGRSAAGSAGYTRGADLAVSVSRAAVGQAIRRFTGPTQEQSMSDWFWGRFSVPVGITLMKRDGHYVPVPVPTADELDAGGVEGTDWFRGGYEYVVTEEIWDDLVADGFAQA